MKIAHVLPSIFSPLLAVPMGQILKPLSIIRQR
jgi:hypothetical protein